MRLSSRFCIAATLFFAPFTALHSEELTVYSSSSFAGKWGPGPKLKEMFEKQCKCTVFLIGNQSTGEMLSSLRMKGGKQATANVVVGLDQISGPEAIKSKLLCPVAGTTDEPYSKMLDPAGHLTAYDYGYLTFMYDSRKIVNPPTSLKAFLKDETYQSKVLIEDPRTSAPGVYLLSYLKSVYGKEFDAGLKALKQKTLTTSKGWSEAYGLFTKGEAPIVWSYTTSEAYHVEIDKVSHYKGMRFSEGHPIQIEGAGISSDICNYKSKRVLAESFLKFLQSPEAQAVIAESNWMYPVKHPEGVKYASFKSLSIPETILQVSNAGDRKKWIDAWLKTFSK